MVEREIITLDHSSIFERMEMNNNGFGIWNLEQIS
jgi:hypothetical protein